MKQKSREEREDLRKSMEKMDEKEEEEHSPLISVMPKLAGEKSPSKPIEQSTKDETERNNIEGINEEMMWCNKWGDDPLKNTYMSIIAIFPPTHRDGCHVTKFAP